MGKKRFWGKIILILIFFCLNSYTFPGQPTAKKLLFENDKILEVQIVGDIGNISKDRGKNKAYHPAKFIYLKNNGDQITVDVLLKTRGIFRLNPRICNFPPLRLKFKKQDVENTIFKGIKKLKMVTHCQNKKKLYQQYLLREYLAYRLFNLFTEMSFRVRLVHVTYIDSGRKNKKLKKYGFFIEPVEMMAARNQCKYLKIDDSTLYTLDSKQSSFLSVFQFMIGNTDWSYIADHNVKRIIPESGGASLGVPYDFDFSGIVDTLYAVPTERAKSTSTKDRFFQGFCQPQAVFDQIFVRFEKHKKEIYSLYENFPLIDKKYKKATLKFLDKFYKIINTPRLVKHYIYKNCVEKTIKK
jgi:hypothetical protein